MFVDEKRRQRTIPSDNPVIPRKTVDMAQKVLQARMMGESHPTTREPVTREQAYAATDLLKLYQTQDRYTPERVRELAKGSNASRNVTDLANLTPEALNAMQEELIKTSA